MSDLTYTNIAFGTAYFVAINVLIASIQMGIPLLLPLALLATVFLIDVAAANIFNSPYVDDAKRFLAYNDTPLTIAVHTYTRNSLLGFLMSSGNYNQYVGAYRFTPKWEVTNLPTPKTSNTLSDSVEITVHKSGENTAKACLSQLSNAEQKLIQEGFDMCCKRS